LSSPSNLFNWFFEPTEPIATFTNKSNNAKKGVHSIVFMNGTKPALRIETSNVTKNRNWARINPMHNSKGDPLLILEK
jgi:hypothetical protein